MKSIEEKDVFTLVAKARNDFVCKNAIMPEHVFIGRNQYCEILDQARLLGDGAFAINKNPMLMGMEMFVVDRDFFVMVA